MQRLSSSPESTGESPHISIRFAPQQLAWIIAQAQEQGITRSQVIRNLVQEQTKKDGANKKKK